MVLYFAQVRDRCGRESEALTLPTAVSAEVVLNAVIALHPAHEPLLRSCRVAIDHAFINGPINISETSEIALIPPVSGG
jgi:molybdopterin converting factor subunit 1